MQTSLLYPRLRAARFFYLFSLPGGRGLYCFLIGLLLLGSSVQAQYQETRLPDGTVVGRYPDGSSPAEMSAKRLLLNAKRSSGNVIRAQAASSMMASSQTFGCTGGQQTYVVPSNVTSLGITVMGARGGQGFGTPGQGGTVSAKLAVTPGTTLYLYVGCTPGGLSGGFNGGGTVTTAPDFSAGGGGASDIRIGGTGLGNRVVVAGGGGGSGGGPGGSGGGTTGANGIGYVHNGVQLTGGGGGGGQSGGGAGGIFTFVSGLSGISNLINGGAGSIGDGGSASSYAGAGVGGGGGGYYGGGGGGAGTSDISGDGLKSGGGGGGGSSYIDNSVNNVTSTQGGNTGSGSIELLACVTPTQFTVTGGGSYCPGTAGVAVGLSGSETNITYRLLLNNAATGATVAGTGSTISFGNQTAVGTYTIEAVNQPNTLCSSVITMAGSATVAVLPLTTVSISASSSIVCEATVVSVTSTASTAATQSVTYQWYKDGVSLGSSQQSLVLSLTSVVPTQSGNYSVVATGTCNSATSSAFSLTVLPMPTVTLLFGGATQSLAGPNLPLITLNRPLDPQNLPVFQVLGGVNNERKQTIDRINGYDISRSDFSTTGVFTIDRLTPYTITVTGANGCNRTVQGLIQAVGQ